MAGGINLYAYTANNPINAIDPFGLESSTLKEQLMQAGAVGIGDALKAEEIAKEAIEKARNSGLPGRFDGPAAAYRHCYWNCRMAQEIGADQAKKVGDIHEECGSNQPGKISMDLKNNMWGRLIGKPGADCDTKCKNLLNNGILQTSPGGTPPKDIY